LPGEGEGRLPHLLQGCAAEVLGTVERRVVEGAAAHDGAVNTEDPGIREAGEVGVVLHQPEDGLHRRVGDGAAGRRGVAGDGTVGTRGAEGDGRAGSPARLEVRYHDRLGEAGRVVAGEGLRPHETGLLTVGDEHDEVV